MRKEGKKRQHHIAERADDEMVEDDGLAAELGAVHADEEAYEDARHCDAHGHVKLELAAHLLRHDGQTTATVCRVCMFCGCQRTCAMKGRRCRRRCSVHECAAAVGEVLVVEKSGRRVVAGAGRRRRRRRQ